MFSPVRQLGEEEVRRDTSSQPGEAAQDREPRQAGDGDPSWRRTGPRPGLRKGPADDQEGDDRHNNEEDEEEGGRKGGEEKSEHVCGGLKREAGPSWFLTCLTETLERSEVPCVCVRPHPDCVRVCLSCSADLDVITVATETTSGCAEPDKCPPVMSDESSQKELRTSRLGVRPSRGHMTDRVNSLPHWSHTHSCSSATGH